MSTHPIIPFHTNLIKIKISINLFNLTKWIKTEKEEQTENTLLYFLFPFLLPTFSFPPLSAFSLPTNLLWLSALSHLPRTKGKLPSLLSILPAEKPSKKTLTHICFEALYSRGMHAWWEANRALFLGPLDDYSSWPVAVSLMGPVDGKASCNLSRCQLGGDGSVHGELEFAWEIGAFMGRKTWLAACLQGQVDF